MISFLIIGLVASVILFVARLYNRMVRSKNQIENAASSLDALYIKRSELIPNLVTTVKQYLKYEASTLEKIVALRNSSTETSPVTEKEGSRALKGALIQLENYPELKANTQFTHLQFNWNESEEQIAAGRRYLSASITLYNDSISTFPANIIASIFNLEEEVWQHATEEQQQNLQAQDLFKNQ